MKDNIANFREDYQAGSLNKEDMLANPIQQFQIWMQAAIQQEVKEPNAMTLATATSDGIPSARIVLLKGYGEDGFVFYTNYNSVKGNELDSNPHAALVFCWLQMERQIRIQGTVERISKEDSTTYFHSRPKGSQIGAWASPQSRTLENRSILENNKANLEQQYAEAEQLPCPPYWGGYRVIPHKIEFWQGRTSRLHDRWRYTKEDGVWKMERLAP